MTWLHGNRTEHFGNHLTQFVEMHPEATSSSTYREQGHQDAFDLVEKTSPLASRPQSLLRLLPPKPADAFRCHACTGASQNVIGNQPQSRDIPRDSGRQSLQYRIYSYHVSPPLNPLSSLNVMFAASSNPSSLYKVCPAGVASNVTGIRTLLPSCFDNLCASDSAFLIPHRTCAAPKQCPSQSGCVARVPR